MTANPNPAQFLTHGLKAQHRTVGTERTVELKAQRELQKKNTYISSVPLQGLTIRKNLGCMNNSKKNRYLGWKTRFSK